MTELKNYKTADFSVTVNARMNGIEIVFNNKMDDKTLAEVKDAGFRWSKQKTQKKTMKFACQSFGKQKMLASVER